MRKMRHGRWRSFQPSSETRNSRGAAAADVRLRDRGPRSARSRRTRGLPRGVPLSLRRHRGARAGDSAHARVPARLRACLGRRLGPAPRPKKGVRPLPALVFQAGHVGEVVAADEHVARTDRLVDDGAVPPRRHRSSRGEPGRSVPGPYAPCRPVSGAGRSDALSPELSRAAREQDLRAKVRRETGGDGGSSPGAWRRSPRARS